MTALEDLRAMQHMDVKTQSDWQLQDYLAEADPNVVVLDRLPVTEIEIRHLTNTRRTA